MPGLSCNACNIEFDNEITQRTHYRTEWHRHNLKRKVAGVPGVSEALFNLRSEALAAERKDSPRMVYRCSLCAKEYSTAKAHAQHVQSKQHINKAAGQTANDFSVVKPAPARTMEHATTRASEAKAEARNSYKLSDESGDDSSDEWEEVDGDDTAGIDMQSIVDEDEDKGKVEDMDITDGEWDPCKCFLCDSDCDGTVEGCVEHMHKEHGFFIPDAEYLKDPRGMLNYLGLKVTKGYMCLFCDDRGKRFQNLEAVRKHMFAKNHCKLRYGDGDGIAEEELEEYYDFSTSYSQEDSSQIVPLSDSREPVSLARGGFELILQTNDDSIKRIGSREFLRYYRQKPRPTNPRDGVLVNALVARYRCLGLSTRQSDLVFGDSKNKRNLPAARAEVMRTKVGMKHNVIWNLPKNCTH